MRVFLCSIFFVSAIFTFGQFAPRHNVVGSNAIKADSSIIIGWANTCLTERGPQNLRNLLLGNASAGSDTSIPNRQGGMVSLGDKGNAVLSFQPPIANGLGPDFVVFENGFESLSGDYLELAFVEASIDGINWYRFPASSLTQTQNQIGTFGTFNDVTQLNNLAGKFIGNFGVPFDLSDLEMAFPSVGFSQISYIRIIDVGGSILSSEGSLDKDGRLINDPFPTPFISSGFDLTGVGVIHQLNTVGLKNFNLPLKNECFRKMGSNWHWADSEGRVPDFVRFFNLLGQEKPIEIQADGGLSLPDSGFLVWRETTNSPIKRQRVVNF